MLSFSVSIDRTTIGVSAALANGGVTGRVMTATPPGARPGAA
jgi:hypothetical protein